MPEPISLSKFFPDPRIFSSEGLVHLGGSLEPEWLLDAYTHGIFPWPFEFQDIPGMQLGWFSPNPRCIFEFDRFHVSRRLERTIRSNRFNVTFDREFESVIHACSEVGDRPHQRWITSEIIDAFIEFHRLGYAHSVETWLDGRLAGGVYGVALGGFFAGESMFHVETNASKVALTALVHHLKKQGYTLFDIQVPTKHTLSLGAVTIPRNEYLRRLQRAIQLPVTFSPDK